MCFVLDGQKCLDVIQVVLDLVIVKPFNHHCGITSWKVQWVPCSIRFNRCNFLVHGLALDWVCFLLYGQKCLDVIQVILDFVKPFSCHCGIISWKVHQVPCSIRFNRCNFLVHGLALDWVCCYIYESARFLKRFNVCNVIL